MPDGEVLHTRLPVQALGCAQAHLQGCVPAWRHHPGASTSLHAQLDLAARSGASTNEQMSPVSGMQTVSSSFYIQRVREGQCVDVNVCYGCDTERERVSDLESNLERVCMRKTSGRETLRLVEWQRLDRERDGNIHLG